MNMYNDIVLEFTALLDGVALYIHAWARIAIWARAVVPNL
jgi:hypothetical protein